MEYCVTVVLSKFDPGPRLPGEALVETAWGPADVDENRLVWSGKLSVHRVAPKSFLLDMVPGRSNGEWVWLDIGGVGVYRFQNPSMVEESAIERSRDEFVELMRYLLGQSDEWVVFYLKDCDSMNETIRQSVDELLDLMIAVRDEVVVSEGFCSMSPNIGQCYLEYGSVDSNTEH